MTTAYHRYMPSDGSMRSSSEFTAATIFSMYEDPVVDVQDAPPVPVLDPKYRSGESKYRSGESNKYRSGESTKYGEPSKYHSGENKYHSGESNKYHSGDSNRYSGKYRPESRPLSMVSERSKDANRRSYGALENGRPERFSYTQPQPQPEPGPSRTYPTRQSSLQPEQAPRTPSPRLTTNTTPYPSTSSPVSPSLLTPIDRERKTSSKHSIVTSQTNHTTPTSLTEYTTRHSTEDADAFRVRATYARLEAEGVPGDGWLEGVERTRTRVVSAASAAVLEASKGAGGKGANVGAEEEARLRSTDRYGFFSQPAPKHEGRLVLLPALALKTFASPHKPAPIPTPSQLPSTRQLNSLPVPVTDPKEDARIAKWERMLVPATQPGSGGIGGGWKWDARKVRKRTERVFKGVPDRWRSAAWGTLVEEPRQRRRESISQLGARYRELLDAPSEHDVQIDLDVPRTISGHVLFHTRYGQGQRSLFYVLHAFAQLCPSCGYVQGMGPIAATLLNYFEPERCYAILVRLHDEYDMHTIFQPGFPGLLESIYVQERLIERLMPGVYQALSKHMISSTSFVTKWYITLFANTVPYQTQLRLWDAFLLEGRDVLVIAAVAILWIVKDHITAPQANFETILSLLSSTFVFEDEDALMRWMERLLTDRRLRDEMDGWRAEWGRLEAEGKGGKALL